MNHFNKPELTLKPASFSWDLALLWKANELIPSQKNAAGTSHPTRYLGAYNNCKTVQNVSNVAILTNRIIYRAYLVPASKRLGYRGQGKNQRTHPAFASDLLEYVGIKWRGAQLALTSPFYRPPSQFRNLPAMSLMAIPDFGEFKPMPVLSRN